MHNSDLVEVLAALRKDERQRLLPYLELTEAIRSDVARQEALRLTLFILDQLETNETSNFSRETAYQRVFPDHPVIHNKLEKSMTDLLSLVRRFIATETASRPMTDLQQQVYLQQFYNERGLADKFRQARNQMGRIRVKHLEWSPQDYYFQFRSEAEEYVFQADRNRKKDDLNLWNTVQALDEYYLVERLWHTCVLLNQNQLAPLALPPLRDWLPFDLHAPRLKWFFEKPLGQLFYQAIELLSDEGGNDEQKLRNFMALLTENENKITAFYISSFEIFACNYGIRRVNKGIPVYSELVFHLQKRRVESGRIYVDHKIKASELHSIVVSGLRLGEYEWVEQFIQRHQNTILGAMTSEGYYQFNLAYFLYHKKDYEPALKTLHTSTYEDMIYKFSSKTLEIKILWAKSRLPGVDHWASEYLENRVEAAIVFFFRGEGMQPDRKKLGKRFADAMKRIIHAVGHGSDRKRLEKIRNDVRKADLIAERQWLLEILGELLGERPASVA